MELPERSCYLLNAEVQYCQVLSDDKKRALYDQYGEDGLKSAVGGGAGAYTVLKISNFALYIFLSALPLISDVCCLLLYPLNPPLPKRPIRLIFLRLSLDQVWVASLEWILHLEHVVRPPSQKVKIYGESSTMF